MHIRIAAALALFLMISSVGCSKPTEERVTYYKHGQYKIVVRSQQFHNLSVQNVDICVAQIDARSFPSDKGQCFLHGFDFSGLSVRWLSDSDVEIGLRASLRVFSKLAKVSLGWVVGVEPAFKGRSNNIQSNGRHVSH